MYRQSKDTLKYYIWKLTFYCKKFTATDNQRHAKISLSSSILYILSDHPCFMLSPKFHLNAVCLSATFFPVLDSTKLFNLTSLSIPFQHHRTTVWTTAAAVCLSRIFFVKRPGKVSSQAEHCHHHGESSTRNYCVVLSVVIPSCDLSQLTEDPCGLMYHLLHIGPLSFAFIWTYVYL